jgi:hypothetical protein
MIISEANLFFIYENLLSKKHLGFEFQYFENIINIHYK